MHTATTAFQGLIDLLTSAETTFLHQRQLSDDVDIGDAYKNILDLVGIGIDCYIDNDPANPHFIKLVSPHRKMGGDNAHALYDFAPLDGEHRYLIRGNIGGVIYLGITLYGGSDESAVTVHANINTRDLDIDSQGNFTLTIGPEDAIPGKHIQSKADTNGIIVRQYFADQDRSQSASLTIDTLAGNAAKLVLDDEGIAKRITRLTNFLRGWTAMTPMPWPQTDDAWNQMTPPFNTGQSTGHWSTPDNIHAFGFFKLADDEALLIHGRSPECLYWSCHLWNNCMHTFDYERVNAAISDKQVQLNADGSWTLVIAKNDPKRPNWISTAEREKGFIYFRWLEAVSVPEALTVEKITLS